MFHFLNIKYKNQILSIILIIILYRSLYMFSYIVNFLSAGKQHCVYNKDYRVGYNKLWINKIRNYRP
jgi:hypothetical protein